MCSNVKKAVSLLIVTTCVFTSPLGIVAKAEKNNFDVSKTKAYFVNTDNNGNKSNGNNDQAQKHMQKTNQNWKLDDLKNDLCTMQRDRERVRDRIKECKDELLSQRLQIRQMLRDCSSEEEQQLLKQERESLKIEMRQIIRQCYTDEEWNRLSEICKEIQNTHREMKIIPVENIITNRGDFKFDTPPIMKEGRVFIPVRAMTEGLGAEVNWDQEEKKVTISKGDVDIVFYLDSGKVLVNGEGKTVDTSAQILNHRTIVPLRFIAENLGFHVDYDVETEMIVID